MCQPAVLVDTEICFIPVPRYVGKMGSLQFNYRLFFWSCSKLYSNIKKHRRRNSKSTLLKSKLIVTCEAIWDAL